MNTQKMEQRYSSTFSPSRIPTQLYTNLGTMKHVDDISKIAKCLISILY